MLNEKEIPIIDFNDEDFVDQLQFALWSTGGSSDYRNDRDRPYNGQSWTDEGESGKTEVKGLTMRDIRDCFIKAVLLSSCNSESDIMDHVLDKPGRTKLPSEKVEDNTWRTQDVYKVDLSKVDPIAIAQNMSCEIEKMMGIFPNLPKE